MLRIEPKPLGQLLISSGKLQPAQLDLALQHQRRAKTQQLLGEILVEQKMCSAAQVAEAFGPCLWNSICPNDAKAGRSESDRDFAP